jgi:hypothetical protein
MKKIFLVLALALFSFSANAQSGAFNVGGHIALPTGDAATGTSFGFGLDVNYMFNSGEEFSYGLASGFQYFLGKTVAGTKVDNGAFLPIAAAGRYNVSDKFFAGADIGYAIGISPSTNNGGFYYRPMVGYTLGENMQLNAFYSGISLTGGTFSSVGVGIMFGL